MLISIQSGLVPRQRKERNKRERMMKSKLWNINFKHFPIVEATNFAKTTLWLRLFIRITGQNKMVETVQMSNEAKLVGSDIQRELCFSCFFFFSNTRISFQNVYTIKPLPTVTGNKQMATNPSHVTTFSARPGLDFLEMPVQKCPRHVFLHTDVELTLLGG